MGVLLNIAIFYIGAIFGNIYINLKKYILAKNSEINKETKKVNKNKSKVKNKKECNEKKGFLANIPIFSFFFCKKCEKCEKNHGLEKIITEILIGIIFVFAFNSVNMTNILLQNEKNISQMEVLLKSGFLVTFPLTLGFVYLIGMTEKTTEKINLTIITYGVIIAAVQIILKFIVNIPNVTYGQKDIISAGIYTIILLLTFVIQMITANKDPESKYVLDIVLIVFILTIYFGSAITITTILLTIITIIIGYVFGVFTNKEYKENISVKKENGKIKTKTEGKYITEYKYIPYSLIIGGISIFVVIMNNYLAMVNILI